MQRLQKPEPGQLPGVRFSLESGPGLCCPDCGATLREDFDAGAVGCDACDRRWSLAECIEALAWVMAKANAELVELQLLLIAEVKMLNGDGVCS